MCSSDLHGEAARGYRQAGIAADTVLGSLGQLNLTYAESRFAGKTGRRGSAFFGTQWDKLSLSAGASRTNGQFAELGDTVYGADFFKAARHPATSASASAGWSSDKLGSFSLSYVYSHTEGQPADGIGSFG